MWAAVPKKEMRFTCGVAVRWAWAVAAARHHAPRCPLRHPQPRQSCHVPTRGALNRHTHTQPHTGRRRGRPEHLRLRSYSCRLICTVHCTRYGSCTAWILRVWPK
jgi:hypothetical protein